MACRRRSKRLMKEEAGITGMDCHEEHQIPLHKKMMRSRGGGSMAHYLLSVSSQEETLPIHNGRGVDLSPLLLNKKNSASSSLSSPLFRKRGHRRRRGGCNEANNSNKKINADKEEDIIIEYDIDIMQHLPLDVLSQILSRVPATSVLKLRCVCKLWSSIIRDPSFIDLHLHNSPSSNPPPFLALFGCGDNFLYRPTLIDDAGVPMPSLGLEFYGNVSMTNPSNGLVGIYDIYTVHICNLTTRELFTLPRHRRDQSQFSFPMISLGFHPATKEYKLVRFAENFCNQGRVESDCDVFTLGSGIWREIGSFEYQIWSSPLALNGAMYWIAFSRSTRERIILLSFDLKDEKFIHIPLPYSKTCIPECRTLRYLLEEEGSICLLESPMPKDSHMDIWMLKDETNHVWIHKYRVLFNWCRTTTPTMPWFVFLKKGKLMFSSKGKLRCVDIQSKSQGCKEFCCIKLFGEANYHPCDAYVYTGSLVSLRKILGGHVPA